MPLHFIIDAYNIVHHGRFTRIRKKTLDPQRALLEIIREKKLTGSPKNKVTLVFDGYPGPVPAPAVPGWQIIFSCQVSADEKIRRLTEKSGSPKETVVVSDDREIGFFARGAGCKTVSVEEFMGEKQERGPKNKMPVKAELTYTQMHRINEELKKIWL